MVEQVPDDKSTYYFIAGTSYFHKYIIKRTESLLTCQNMVKLSKVKHAVIELGQIDGQIVKRERKISLQPAGHKLFSILFDSSKSENRRLWFTTTYSGNIMGHVSLEINTRRKTKTIVE